MWTPAGVVGGVAPATRITGALKPGPRLATGVSAITVGACGLVGLTGPAHADGQMFADGQTLNFRQLASVVERTELPCVSGTAVAYAESSGDSGVISEIPGEDSRGLFQINEAHGFDFDWNDPYANAHKAADIYEAAGGWSPWGAYTNGSYQAYMDEAQAACSNPAQLGTVETDSPKPEAIEEAAEVATEEAADSYVGKHRKREAAATYTVQPGDTLAQIARGQGTTWQHLMEMNPDIDNPALIFPGDKLDVTDHSVQ